MSTDTLNILANIIKNVDLSGVQEIMLGTTKRGRKRSVYDMVRSTRKENRKERELALYGEPRSKKRKKKKNISKKKFRFNGNFYL